MYLGIWFSAKDILFIHLFDFHTCMIFQRSIMHVLKEGLGKDIDKEEMYNLGFTLSISERTALS